MIFFRLNSKKLKIISVLLAIVFLIAGVPGCSGSGGNDTAAAGNKKLNKTRSASSQGEDEASDSQSEINEVQIKKVYFTPFYDKLNGKSLKINVETTSPKSDNQYFVYHYWKNFQRISKKEEGDNIIPYSSFKTGDYLYVDALLFEDEQLLDKKRSEGMLVKNMAPVIEKVSLPDIDGPGTYQIPVQALDPEGDKIIFSLDGKPLYKGLSIDAETGTITCTMGTEPPPREMKFIIVAKDEKGGITKKAVSISFKIHNQKKS